MMFVTLSNFPKLTHHLDILFCAGPAQVSWPLLKKLGCLLFSYCLPVDLYIFWGLLFHCLNGGFWWRGVPSFNEVESLRFECSSTRLLSAIFSTLDKSQTSAKVGRESTLWERGRKSPTTFLISGPSCSWAWPRTSSSLVWIFYSSFNPGISLILASFQ